ncbi:MAG: ABC transporter permease subunit, partial [Bacteroidales bacterium]|nr:ABC transporter permease subunit [Bacteroidales bacterium]
MIQKIKSQLFAFILGVILPILLVLLWNWGVKTEVLPPSLIASPEKVWSKFKLLIDDEILLHNAQVSLFRLFAGFLLGSIIGITLGIIVGVSKIASKIFEPLLLVLIPVPPLAWIPLLIIAFGIDQGAKISLLSIGSFCTLFLTTSFAVKATDKNLLELSRLYSKEWFVKLFKIILPFSASNIIGSLRVAMALSWTLLMASEMIASS